MGSWKDVQRRYRGHAAHGLAKYLRRRDRRNVDEPIVASFEVEHWLKEPQYTKSLYTASLLATFASLAHSFDRKPSRSFPSFAIGCSLFQFEIATCEPEFPFLRLGCKI